MANSRKRVGQRIIRATDQAEERRRSVLDFSVLCVRYLGALCVSKSKFPKVSRLFNTSEVLPRTVGSPAGHMLDLLLASGGLSHDKCRDGVLAHLR